MIPPAHVELVGALDELPGCSVDFGSHPEQGPPAVGEVSMTPIGSRLFIWLDDEQKPTGKRISAPPMRGGPHHELPRRRNLLGPVLDPAHRRIAFAAGSVLLRYPDEHLVEDLTLIIVGDGRASQSLATGLRKTDRASPRQNRCSKPPSAVRGHLRPQAPLLSVPQLLPERRHT